MLKHLRPQLSLSETKEDLYTILSHFSNEHRIWLTNKLQANTNIGNIYLTYSLVPRFIPRIALDLLNGYFSKHLRKLNHSTNSWTADQIARLIILLEAGSQGNDKFHEIITMLLGTAEYQEQICIYKSLMFLPYHECLTNQAIEGLRSNIGEVFGSIALQNSYPYYYFSEDAWNQMVLKALFINKPIREIIGIDERANSRLSNIAIDLAHERWAAGREVSPELWRVTVGFLNESHSNEVKKLLSGSEKEQKVAQYLCDNSNFGSIQALGNGESQTEFNWAKI